jgi:hypothetical protein
VPVVLPGVAVAVLEGLLALDGVEALFEDVVEPDDVLPGMVEPGAAVLVEGADVDVPVDVVDDDALGLDLLAPWLDVSEPGVVLAVC